MKIKLFTFIICAAALLNACHDDEPVTPTPEPVIPTPEPVSAKADRTVLVYIAGDNSLTSFADIDLQEMVKGIAGVDTKNNNLIVYMDRKYTNPQLIRLCRNTNNVIIQDTLKSYSSRNSVGVSEMLEVLTDVYRDFPATHYGLTLWSHGEGWLPASSAMTLKATTRWFGQDGTYYMSIFDLHQVLKSVPHLDFVLFDACFMQSVEVVHELRDCADYFIGSPTEIPGPGAPYDKVVPAFFAAGSVEDVAKNIASQYYGYYAAIYDDTRAPQNSNWTGGVSIGVMKSSALPSLATETQRIVNTYVPMDTPIDVTSLLYYGRGGRSYYYTDISAFINQVTLGDASFNQWKQSFDAAMVYYMTTPKNYSTSESTSPYGLFSMVGSCGLSMYIPCRSTLKDRANYNLYYAGYDWYEDLGWASKGW